MCNKVISYTDDFLDFMVKIIFLCRSERKNLVAAISTQSKIKKLHSDADIDNG